MASIYLLVNKLRPDLVKKGDMMSSEDVSEILGSEIIGCINDDVNVVIATNRGEAFSRPEYINRKVLNPHSRKVNRGKDLYGQGRKKIFSSVF